MKKLNISILCSMLLFVINSCDYLGKTEIKIINESYYNLHIQFIVESNNITTDELSQYKDIIIDKNKTVTFLLTVLNDIRNPNNEVVKIILINNDNNEIIKNINNNENIFKLIKSDKYYTSYQFTINNDLLL